MRLAFNIEANFSIFRSRSIWLRLARARNHTFAKLILAMAAVSLTAAAARAQQPEVIAQLGRERIYEGESVDYQVILNHIENPSAPDLSAFTDFEVVPAGQQSLNSSSVSINNGRITKTERRGRAYNYRLTPRTSGRLIVPAPKAKADGRVIEGRELTLDVIEPAAQDVVRMEITAEPQDVYPMQPFTVTLSILVKPVSDRRVDKNPLDVLSKAPQLSIPWVDDEQLPAGLEPKVDWKKWLGNYRGSGRSGFVVNNIIGRSSIMSMFEDRSELLFGPRPTRVLANDDDGKPLEYWKYSFRRTFIAKSPGTYTFGPAALKGLFADGVADDGRLRGRDIYTMARPLVFTVKDVPASGRPDSYNGLVGKFTVAATLSPKKVKVGDPMTLTLNISGRGTLGNAVAPDIAALLQKDTGPGVEQRFKVYDATEKTNGDSIDFTYSIRPLNEGNDPFPPIAVSYFDVSTGRYETVETKPIPIEVGKAERLSARKIVAAHRPGGGGNSQIEARREGIFANVTDLAAVHDDGVRPLHWFVGLVVLAVLYIVLTFATRRFKRLRGDTALLRRRGAASAARAQLRQGLNLLTGGDTREGTQFVKDALTGLVADTADLSRAGLTPKDVAAQLEKFNVSGELISRVQSLLETCDAARYAAAGLDAAALAREARDVFDSLAKELKSKGLFR